MTSYKEHQTSSFDVFLYFTEQLQGITTHNRREGNETKKEKQTRIDEFRTRFFCVPRRFVPGGLRVDEQSAVFSVVAPSGPVNV